MKYSEFLQLDEALRAQGTTIQEELGLPDSLLLNEVEMVRSDVKADSSKETKTTETSEPDKSSGLETEKTTLAGRAFSRWARIKNSLNKQGKKIQKQINKEIIEKYLPDVIKAELTIINQIKEQSKVKQQPKEIIEAIRANLIEAKNLQNRQYNIIVSAITKMLENTTASMDKKISSSSANEKNKLRLKNYWLLLTTQININALSNIQNVLQEKSKAEIGDNKVAEEAHSAITGSKLLNNKREELTSTAQKQKEEVKKIEAEMAEEEKGTDDKETAGSEDAATETGKETKKVTKKPEKETEKAAV